LSSLLTVSLAAQLGAAPLTAHYFHLVSTISLLANLILVPIVALILPLSLLLWPLALLAPSIAQFIAHSTLTPLINALIAVVATLSRVPGAAWSTASPGLAVVALIYAAYFGALYTVGILLRRRNSLHTPLSEKGALVDA
jgi:competence protein ComEC